MFDGLKNLGNMGEMLRQAGQMQEKMKAMQEELARKQVTADAGAGMVQATVNGKLELIKLKIDKSKFDIQDVEMLQDAVVAAVSAAQLRAQEMMKEAMTKAFGDMGLPPGLLS